MDTPQLYQRRKHGNSNKSCLKSKKIEGLSEPFKGTSCTHTSGNGGQNMGQSSFRPARWRLIQRLPYELEIIWELVSDFEEILRHDRAELDTLFNLANGRTIAKASWSRKALMQALHRYEDGNFIKFLENVVGQNPDSWFEWVYTAESEGKNLRGWLKWHADLKKCRDNFPKGANYDWAYNEGVLRLWLGEKKTQRISGLLFQYEIERIDFPVRPPTAIFRQSPAV
jgi:hypothetical protein